MDVRTWQEAGARAGSYSARHRARSPFSPLRPAPIAIGSLSTAAIAAFAFVAPGILHGSPAGASSTVLDGAPNLRAPMAPGNNGAAAPGFVSVTAPAGPSSDSPAAPNSTAPFPAVATSSSPAPLTEHAPTGSAPSSRPSQTTPTQTQSQTTPSTSPTSPGQQPPTAPPTTPTTPFSPVAPPTTAPTAPTSFNSAAAVSSALTEVGNARRQQGISLLNVDTLLTKAAKTHSQDMARTGHFSHIGSDGSDPFSRAANLGCFKLSQELIAHGKPGDDVIGALLRDPASKRALLSFWNSTIGVSAQQDPATGDVYWTIELGWL
jgi:uncharacterized protein YkwD